MRAEIFFQSTVFETFLLLSSRKIAYCFLSLLRQDVPRSSRCVGSDKAIGGHFPYFERPSFCGRDKRTTLVGSHSPFAECPTIYVRKNLGPSAAGQKV